LHKTLKVVIQILGWALIVAPSICKAESLRLYVNNSRGDSVSVIDLGSLEVVKEITVGEHAHGVAVQPDGKRLFATIESDHTLKIVDLEKNAIIASVKLTGRPNQCAVTPDGKYVVVPIRDGDSVNIVDVSRSLVVKVLPIKEPHNAVSVGSNRYVYVSSMGGNEIDVIDLEKMDYSDHIPVGGRPRPYVLSKDGKTMYVALANLHGFVIVDIPRKQVTRRVEIPAKTPGPPKPLAFETPDTRTHGLALSPDEHELWVTSLVDDVIYIYDIKEQKTVASIATGEGPNWIVFSPDGKFAAVTNTDSSDVSIFNVRTRKELARVKVGAAPKRIAVGIVD
jgi:YVTN family beta-propeller protein